MVASGDLSEDHDHGERDGQEDIHNGVYAGPGHNDQQRAHAINGGRLDVLKGPTGLTESEERKEIDLGEEGRVQCQAGEGRGGWEEWAEGRRVYFSIGRFLLVRKSFWSASGTRRPVSM